MEIIEESALQKASDVKNKFLDEKTHGKKNMILQNMIIFMNQKYDL